MIDQVPTAVFVRWTLFGVAALTVWILLGLGGMGGLVPVLFALMFLLIFHPPRFRNT